MAGRNGGIIGPTRDISTPKTKVTSFTSSGTFNKANCQSTTAPEILVVGGGGAAGNGRAGGGGGGGAGGAGTAAQVPGTQAGNGGAGTAKSYEGSVWTEKSLENKEDKKFGEPIWVWRK